MIGTRRRLARVSGPQTLVVSVLALLALACFPVLAHADSSEVQYQDAPPTVTGTKVPTDRQPPGGASKQAHHDGSAPPAKASNADGSRSSGKGSATDGSSSGSGADTAGTGQQGSPGKASGQGSSSPGKTAGKAEPASTGSDGGSSPLVPILIAILVLAAISLGAVIVQRRRRGTPGAPVSPKAG
jgi:cobalamin biosynthesis Mg chelatase CobN